MTGRTFRWFPLLSGVALASCALGRDVRPDRLSPAWQHDWARGAVFYQVFVRSFADSDGDGVGDLAGLTARLDYLNDGDSTTTTDLGVDGIWLMPVFESPSYHGYDTVDYRRIDAEYGDLAAFQRLIAEARRRGIRVIVDLVMNHTSSRHPWFVEAAASADSPRRNWYEWRSADPGWTQPWGGANRTWHRSGDSYYYGVFWGGMPDLNFRNPAVRREMQEIAGVWLHAGLDGFRLDATRHLVADGPGAAQNDTPETHVVLQEFSDAVRRVKPSAILVGENWTDTAAIAPYFGRDDGHGGSTELPLNFNFPLADAIRDGLLRQTAEPIVRVLAEMAARYPTFAMDAPFLANHDQVRLATQLRRDPALLRSAAGILLTLPGTAFLYYGEEVGIENGPTEGDESKRTPMPWDSTATGGFSTAAPWFPFGPGRERANVAVQTSDEQSLLSWYRRLISARRSSTALRLGDLALVTPPDAPSGILAFVRRTPADEILAIHNLTDRPILSPTLDMRLPAAPPLVSTESAAVVPGDRGWRVQLPAHGSAAWRIPR
jgi:glycosidase